MSQQLLIEEYAKQNLNSNDQAKQDLDRFSRLVEIVYRHKINKKIND